MWFEKNYNPPSKMVIKKKMLFYLVVLVIFSSCSNGKLEFRNGCPDYWKGNISKFIAGENAKTVFLVNSSRNKKIIFTIKKTEFSQWSPYDDKTYYLSKTEVKTKIIALNPGEESELGCNNIVYYDDPNYFHTWKYEVVGELEEK